MSSWGGPPEQSDGEEGEPSLEEAFAGRSRRPPSPEPWKTIHL
jgi:hypothetical protein